MGSGYPQSNPTSVFTTSTPYPPSSDGNNYNQPSGIYNSYPPQQIVYPSTDNPSNLTTSYAQPLGPNNITVARYDALNGQVDISGGANLSQVPPPSYNDATEKF